MGLWVHGDKRLCISMQRLVFSIWAWLLYRPITLWMRLISDLRDSVSPPGLLSSVLSTFNIWLRCDYINVCRLHVTASSLHVHTVPAGMKRYSKSCGTSPTPAPETLQAGSSHRWECTMLDKWNPLRLLSRSKVTEVPPLKGGCLALHPHTYTLSHKHPPEARSPPVSWQRSEGRHTFKSQMQTLNPWQSFSFLFLLSSILLHLTTSPLKQPLCKPRSNGKCYISMHLVLKIPPRLAVEYLW